MIQICQQNKCLGMENKKLTYVDAYIFVHVLSLSLTYSQVWSFSSM